MYVSYRRRQWARTCSMIFGSSQDRWPIPFSASLMASASPRRATASIILASVFCSSVKS